MKIPTAMNKYVSGFRALNHSPKYSNKLMAALERSHDYIGHAVQYNA